MSRGFKICLKIFAGIAGFFAVSVCILLFTEVGRNFAVKCVGKYLQSQNIELQVNGISGDFTKFDEIKVKIPDSTEFHFFNVAVDDKKQLDNHKIKIDKLIVIQNSVQNSIQNSGGKIDALKIVSFVTVFRKFVAELALNEGIFRNENGELHVDNLRYKSESSADLLSAKINREYDVSAKVARSFFGCDNVSINFGNVHGFSGTCVFYGYRLRDYDIYAANDILKIKGKGNYRDLMKEIFVNSMSVSYNKKVYRLSGVIYPAEKSAEINTKISFSEYLKDLPAEIRTNFDDTIFAFKVNYKFGGKSTAKVDVIKSGKVIGNANGVLDGRSISITGDANWINLYGFKLKSFNCKIDDFEKADITIFGDEFKVTTHYNKGIVSDFAIELLKNGSVKSTSAFTLDPAAKIPFEFNLQNIDFLNRFCSRKFSGDFKGTGEYKSGEAQIKGRSKKIVCDKYEIRDADISYEKDNVILTAENLTAQDFVLSNCDVRLKDGALKVKCKTASGFPITASGKISNSYQKISLNNFGIISSGARLNVKVFDLDFANKNHKILCEISSGKTRGILDISAKNDSYNLVLDSINTESLQKILGAKLPKCSINGRLNFDMRGDFAKGSGNIKILGLFFQKNVMNIAALIDESGVNLDANFENASEFFKINAYLPFLFGKDGSLSQKSDAQMRCSIKGNTKIENFLELSDMKDVRGDLNCDISLFGSARSPVLSGTASLKNAYFVINDIILKNGFISLKCNGNNINVEKAYFIDGKGKKANITGSGKFFFNGLIPNINTNLALRFEDFRLFDSDDMRIVVNGPGAITGKINDLTISGNVSIPKCEIMKFHTNSSVDRIHIDNEKHIPKKVSEEKKADFCRYSINMVCPKVAVIGKGFEIDLRGNLRLATYQEKTTLIGKLKASGGKVSIFGKRMKLISGYVTFVQENPFDPDMRFVCENKFGDITAFLEVENKPGKGMTLNLKSRPDYSQDVILSNIMFGKDTKHLSVTEAAQLAHAVTRLKNKGGILSIFDVVQEAGIIDNISFSANSTQSDDSLLANEQQSDNTHGVNLSAGKYLHDNVYVSVNKKSEEESASLDVDVSLSDSLSVKANTNGEAGISWKYRY